MNSYFSTWAASLICREPLCYWVRGYAYAVKKMRFFCMNQTLIFQWAVSHFTRWSLTVLRILLLWLLYRYYYDYCFRRLGTRNKSSSRFQPLHGTEHNTDVDKTNRCDFPGFEPQILSLIWITVWPHEYRIITILTVTILNTSLH